MLRAAIAALTVLAAPALACSAPPWLNAVSGSDVSVDTSDDTAVSRAWYADLSRDYGHAILGDALEPTTLHVWSVATSAQCGLSVKAGSGHVFEDVAPRLVDVDGDNQPEVIAIRSSTRLGGQIVVYKASATGLTILAETPYIGRRNRWLAPAGIGDLDGDGHVEVAYVDRPHLAKTLRIWRFRDGDFREVTAVAGLTNHRIGEDFISGGLRDCGAGPELVLANADWSRRVFVRFSGGTVTVSDAGPWSQDAAVRALACAG